MDNHRNWRGGRGHPEFAHGNWAGSGAFRDSAYNHWMAVRDHLPRERYLWTVFLILWTLAATVGLGAFINKTTGHVTRVYSVITGQPADPIRF